MPQTTKLKEKIVGEKRVTMWELPYGKVYRITCHVSGREVSSKENYIWKAETKSSAVAEYLYNFED